MPASRSASADVFVNVAGGVRIEEPGADLAVALAIASAARGAPVREGLAAFGEIGLTGRLRPASQAERRLEECAKLGIVDRRRSAERHARVDVRGRRVRRRCATRSRPAWSREPRRGGCRVGLAAAVAVPLIACEERAMM